MLNFEKYRSSVLDLKLLDAFALNMETGEVAHCSNIMCSKCRFNDSELECADRRIQWFYEEYEPISPDWNKVAIDTKVLVSDNGGFWCNCYFAGVNEEGKPMVWRDGATSWSIRGLPKRITYRYIQLAEE